MLRTSHTPFAAFLMARQFELKELNKVREGSNTKIVFGFDVDDIEARQIEMSYYAGTSFVEPNAYESAKKRLLTLIADSRN